MIKGIIFEPRERVAEREAVRKAINENASFTTAFVAMNALATVVASYGLLENSTAVVIGAMVIATLLGPVSGIALSLVDGDISLLRRALLAEALGVVAVLAVAIVIGRIHRDIPLTHEILVRTSPNILDLMIALAGGAAGAYATISPKVSASLVGVAIATAVVPPLAACGLCLARGNVSLAGGAFLLFFANILAIQFASSLVLWLNGFHRVTRLPQDGKKVLTRNAVTAALLLILAAVFGYNFSQSVARERFHADVRVRLEHALARYPGVYLADLRFDHAQNASVVTAVIRTPYSFDPPTVAKLELGLPKPPEGTLDLHVRSVIAKEVTRDGYLHEMPPGGSDDVGFDTAR